MNEAMHKVSHVAQKLVRQVRPPSVRLDSRPHVRAWPGLGRRVAKDTARGTHGEPSAGIDDRLTERVQACVKAGPKAVQQRLAELDREWDAGRWLQVPAASVALGGVLACATTGQRRWLALPLVAVPLALLPAFGHLALPRIADAWAERAFGKLGVRTRRAIDRERIALHVLRGDYDLRDAPHDPKARIQHVLRHAA